MMSRMLYNPVTGETLRDHGDAMHAMTTEGVRIPARATCKVHHCPCGKKGTSRCGHCRTQCYCSTECQKKHWPKHKTVCRHVTRKLAKTFTSEVLSAVLTHVENCPSTVLRLPSKIWQLVQEDDHGCFIFLAITREKFASIVAILNDDHFLQHHMAHLDSGGSIIVSELPGKSGVSLVFHQ